MGPVDAGVDDRDPDTAAVNLLSGELDGTVEHALTPRCFVGRIHRIGKCPVRLEVGDAGYLRHAEDLLAGSGDEKDPYLPITRPHLQAGKLGRVGDRSK
jgi:hypothetical protein